MKFIFILLFVLLSSLFAVAQQSDSQLAYTYYQRKEYDKAAEVFLKLYERTRSANFLDYHIVCLINAQKYEQAEETLKQYLKTDDSNKDFLVNLGYIYGQQGKTRKAEEYYAKAIKKLIPQNADINSLAYKFRNIKEYEWAIQTYLRGREILKKPDAFMLELGDNYMMERDYERMLDIFFCQLELKPADINNITSKLSFARSYDLVNNVDTVIENKLKEVYRQTNYLPVFDELGVWYALQKKEYEQAFSHAILLNQKTADKLYIFLNIARNAVNADDYIIGEKAYHKILEKGKEKNNYYITARKEILKCKYKNYLQHAATAEAYKQLASEGEKYMQEYGYTPANTDIVLLLADLYAYYLQDSGQAEQVLDKSIHIPRLNIHLLNTLKSKKADLLAFMDNPWEATILYTQIEKSSPNDDIGYEAKLKKAWLAYYAGDLLWAKAQFDVLKGATSKLISNDALKMAHFIQTNYEEGGNNQDLEKLAQTEYLIYKKQISGAIPALDSLISHAANGIADYATLLKARILADSSAYEQACHLLEKLKKDAGETYVVAEAIFRLADIKTKMKDMHQAKELYKLLVSEYSGSVYSIEASKLYREIEKN